MISSKIQTEIIGRIAADSGSFSIRLQGKDYLVVYNTVSSNGWKVISTIPISIIETQNQKFLMTNLMMILITLTVVILISVWVSSRIARPLERVGKAMESIEKGDFEVRLNYDSSNEVGKITKRYNAMAVEIKSLMNKIRVEEKKKKEAYIHALQAQIKPHFLYNTLFTIKCLASIKRQPEIEELLDSLIKLLMASISKGGEFVKVRDEIQYVENFILIQKYRIGNKFKVIYDIDPEIDDLIILKLLIQPIVENALVHGMEEGGNINVCVSGKIEEGKLVFRISDNGKGTDADKINRLLQAGETVNKSVFSGMGILNVNERIKLYFGEEYGLYYSESLDKGTEAVISLPIIMDERGIEQYV